MMCSRGRRSLLRAALAPLLALVVASGWARTPASAPPRPAHLPPPLAAQVSTARHELAAPAPAASAPAVLLVAAALDGNSNAFVGDVRLAEHRLRPLAPRLGTLQLGNAGAPRDWPAASKRNLAVAFAEAGRLLRAAPGPRLAVVLLTSHGDVGHLALEDRRTRELQLVSGAQLQRWLQPLAGVPTLVIVSACHSGSLLPSLREPHRIVMAAARRDRSSFGCETESRNTYFVDELFRTLDPHASPEQWFGATARSVAERERRMKLAPPSEPQLEVGSAMQALARQPLGELLGTRR